MAERVLWAPAALIHQQDTDELALELSLRAEQEMQEYRERFDRLLAQIEQRQLVVEKRQEETIPHVVFSH